MLSPSSRIRTKRTITSRNRRIPACRGSCSGRVDNFTPATIASPSRAGAGLNALERHPGAHLPRGNLALARRAPSSSCVRCASYPYRFTHRNRDSLVPEIVPSSLALNQSNSLLALHAANAGSHSRNLHPLEQLLRLLNQTRGRRAGKRSLGRGFTTAQEVQGFSRGAAWGRPG